MADVPLCTACDRIARMRCSECWKASVVVPFCGIEHQKLLWCTHKAICGRVLREPFMPPLTDGEHLAESMMEIKRDPDRPGCHMSHLEELVPASARPLVVEGNKLDKLSDLPKIYLDAFNTSWTRKKQSYLAYRSNPIISAGYNPNSSRSILLDGAQHYPAPDYIYPPPLHRSVAPYTWISEAIGQLYREPAIMQGRNVVGYINAMVVWSTVATYYFRSPTTTVPAHYAQLEVLRARAEEANRKVLLRGKRVMEQQQLPFMGPRIENPSETEEVKTPLDWSLKWFNLIAHRFMVDQKPYAMLR